jgi:hypothetical protein
MGLEEWLGIVILVLRLRRRFPPATSFPKKVDAPDVRPGVLGDSRRRRFAFMPRPDSSVVERGPEKAGVGGSIPSLATI